MPDLLASASSWLNTVCKEQISQTVQIQVGAAKSGDVSATIGSTEFDSENSDGIVEHWQSRDYLIAVADYKVNNVVIKPDAGHKIIEAGRIYRVLSPGDEPAARYSDAAQEMWRIHTKLLAE